MIMCKCVCLCVCDLCVEHDRVIEECALITSPSVSLSHSLSPSATASSALRLINLPFLSYARALDKITKLARRNERE